jgi:hypothetical protein
MAAVHTLHSLVQSLSKAEKRYFRLFCELQGGNKVYVGLYQLLEQCTDDPTAIAADFSRQHPEAVFETACKYLYRNLMKSLRSFQTDKSIDSRLMHRISDCQILFNKGLMDICFDELEKAKALAIRYEKFPYFLTLARMELEFLTKLEFPGMDEANLVARQEKINEVINQESWLNRHSALYEVLSYRYFHQGPTRSQHETEQLNDLLLEEFQIISNKHYNSLSSSIIHLHFQSTYFMMTGNDTESLRLSYELHQVFADNPRLLNDAPIHYLYLINSLLTDLRAMRKYEEMVFFIGHLQALPARSENLDGFIGQLVYQHQLARMIDLGQFAEAFGLVESYQQQLSGKASVIPPNFGATLQLLTALVYFGRQDLPTALRHLNQVLNASPGYISHQVHILCRLLRLVVHFELNNYDYLQYEIRSIERKLKVEKKLFKLEKLTMRFLKKAVASPPSVKQFRQFQDELNPLATDPHERQLLKWFDIICWVESKIGRISFEELVREKSRTWSALPTAVGR